MSLDAMDLHVETALVREELREQLAPLREIRDLLAEIRDLLRVQDSPPARGSNETTDRT